MCLFKAALRFPVGSNPLDDLVGKLATPPGSRLRARTLNRCWLARARTNALLALCAITASNFSSFIVFHNFELLSETTVPSRIGTQELTVAFPVVNPMTGRSEVPGVFHETGEMFAVAPEHDSASNEKPQSPRHRAGAIRDVEAKDVHVTGPSSQASGTQRPVSSKCRQRLQRPDDIYDSGS